MDDVGGGACEVIGDLNESLWSRYFLGIVNDRTGFASYTSAFKSARFDISLDGTSDQKLSMLLLHLNEMSGCTSLWIILE